MRITGAEGAVGPTFDAPLICRTFRHACRLGRGTRNAYFVDDFASCCHVSMIVSGFSEIDLMPSSVSH
jgi:hypothetical protein